MKIFLLTLALGGILAAVMFGVLTGWDASAMSVHGWIALSLGTFLSLAVGGGLMALVFYSARRGYDERADFRRPDDPV
jgi:hypothetical protein